MSQLEAWEMVHVDQSFLNSTHGQMGCISCHNGNNNAFDKDQAHLDLVAAPSDSHDVFCGGCHADIMANHRSSLHANMQGYFAAIEKRSGINIEHDPNIRPKFDKECGKCHASCGQCHISRPVSVNGGFVKGHNFYKTPNDNENCTACHGSRVGAEYHGENDGLKADVHWIPNVKKCSFCHTGEAMHGSSAGAEHRLDDMDMVKCEDCHEGTQDANDYHKKHWGELSCQVCHSQSYKSCNSCHTGGAGITGSSYMTFKIGKNYKKSASRPYDYITVRHIPVSRDTYASWGITDLPNYDAEPTWKYATPHNIQRWTPQTQSEGRCGASCHDSDYYLTMQDVVPEEVNANKDVVMN